MVAGAVLSDNRWKGDHVRPELVKQSDEEHSGRQRFRPYGAEGYSEIHSNINGLWLTPLAEGCSLVAEAGRVL